MASSRRIAQRLREDIAIRVLAANNTPDFRTISDFRKDHLRELSKLFLGVLSVCQRAGLVKLGHVSLDGTKVKANASKHKAMSYGRMREKCAELEAEVEQLLRRAAELDEEEDRRFGRDKRGDELPAELAFREGRLRKIREAMGALEAEVEAVSEDGAHSGVPDESAQRNFTDPESRIMPERGGRQYVQAYNSQAVVDSSSQVIVAARATNQSSDKRQAVVMMEEAIANAGEVPREVSADAGYYSAEATEKIHALGMDPFIAPDQTRHGRILPPAPRGRIPKHLSARDRMRRKLRTKRGRQRYALRMETVEPVFGQIKHGRGFRQFLLRGLDKVNGEWLLICLGHNLLKLYRAGFKLRAETGLRRTVEAASNPSEPMGDTIFRELMGHLRLRGAKWLSPSDPGHISLNPLPLLGHTPSYIIPNMSGGRGTPVTCGPCALWSRTSASSWAMTPVTPLTFSPNPGSATVCLDIRRKNTRLSEQVLKIPSIETAMMLGRSRFGSNPKCCWPVR